MKYIHTLYWTFFYQFFFVEKLLSGEYNLTCFSGHCEFYDIVSVSCFYFLATGIIWDVVIAFLIMRLFKKRKVVSDAIDMTK